MKYTIRYLFGMKLAKILYSFVPTEDLMELFRNDYSRMRDGMIYGTPDDFDTIIQKIKAINAWINKI